MCCVWRVFCVCHVCGVSRVCCARMCCAWLVCLYVVWAVPTLHQMLLHLQPTVHCSHRTLLLSPLLELPMLLTPLLRFPHAWHTVHSTRFDPHRPNPQNDISWCTGAERGSGRRVHHSDQWSRHRGHSGSCSGATNSTADIHVPQTDAMIEIHRQLDIADIHLSVGAHEQSIANMAQT